MVNNGSLTNPRRLKLGMEGFAVYIRATPRVGHISVYRVLSATILNKLASNKFQTLLFRKIVYYYHFFLKGIKEK